MGTLYGGGFAGTVGTEQGGDLAAERFEVDSIKDAHHFSFKCGHRAEVLNQPIDLQARGVGAEHLTILRDVVSPRLRRSAGLCEGSPYWNGGLNYVMIVLCIP
ncbi:hypothetical protein GCM10027402_22040 [Arthrobacter monumenti]